MLPPSNELTTHRTSVLRPADCPCTASGTGRARHWRLGKGTEKVPFGPARANDLFWADLRRIKLKNQRSLGRVQNTDEPVYSLRRNPKSVSGITRTSKGCGYFDLCSHYQNSLYDRKHVVSSEYPAQVGFLFSGWLVPVAGEVLSLPPVRSERRGASHLP